jgi:UDP-N-acetylmuramate dehydrogenase
VTSFADLTTMQVGGHIPDYHQYSSTSSLVAGAKKIWKEDKPWLALGSGSNLVVSDVECDFAVMHIQTRGVTVKKAVGQKVIIHAEAGEDWDGFVAHTLSQGVRGLETLSGIPGTVGASIVQNVGAYGAEISDTVVSIDFLDYPAASRRTILAGDLELALRSSAIKTGKLNGLVLGVTFSLEPSEDGTSIPMLYDQLAGALGIEVGMRAPLAQVRDTVLALRSSKGMVLSQSDPDSVSSGSFFLNPVVSEKVAFGLPTDAPRWLVGPEPQDVVISLDGPAGEKIPALDSSEAWMKLSAAWLIEYSGISKGFALPGSKAAISSKHALAITNRGGASADDIAELARYVITTVGNATGIYLVPEPTLIGLEV